MNRAGNTTGRAPIENGNTRTRVTENGMNGSRGEVQGRTSNGGGRVSNFNTSARDTALLDEIRRLSFVKVELELYLDTHPNCRVALDYYHRTVDALNKLMEQYHATGHLVRAEGSQSEDEWEWVKTPWPWQKVGELTDEWREER